MGTIKEKIKNWSEDKIFIFPYPLDFLRSISVDKKDIFSLIS